MKFFHPSRLLLLLAAAAYIWTASIEQEFSARWSKATPATENGMQNTAAYIYLEGQRVWVHGHMAAATSLEPSAASIVEP